MRMNESWRIVRATAGDAAAILAVQYRAYALEAELYGGITLPPQRETVAELHALLATHTVLKAVLDETIVGAVRGREEGGTCHIGRLVVAPEYHGQGLGSALLAAIEEAFADVRRFELFTGDRSLKNLGFYGRRGYTEFRREPEPGHATLVFLEKPAKLRA
jgi:GNAT superfamily N-acetyltransferase